MKCHLAWTQARGTLHHGMCRNYWWVSLGRVGVVAEVWALLVEVAFGLLLGQVCVGGRCRLVAMDDKAMYFPRNLKIVGRILLPMAHLMFHGGVWLDRWVGLVHGYGVGGWAFMF